MKDLVGQTFLVTGANTGIGLATACDLALRGGRLYIACRSEAKGRAVVDDIVRTTGNEAVAFLSLDLADLASVRRCAEDFLALGQPLHGLINNAGVAGHQGITRDGFELAFGVNHLGHFLLTTAVLDCLVASAPARVVTVSSDGHYRAKGIDFTMLRKPTHSITGFPEYAVSKLCNVLFTQELGRRLAGRGVTTYAVNPGAVASDIWRRVPWPIRPLIKMPMRSTEDGARTSVYCATAPELAGVTGRFYDNCRERQPSRVVSEELARLLWEHSETWTAA
ncbi:MULTISPECIES: SDR family oxidoreductase [unclassified Frankia]|uniref:SDR family oxidoreductase n=1 Tax=unclassified Frankia TaxID=2632575 RepID=UPI002AD38A57|nr:MULTISPECIES: SDR family oxidoreductase [unclassified Frankia]